MIDSRWKQIFPSHILARGEGYAAGGNVGDLRVGEDRITAAVYGSSVYRVSIELENGWPTEMRCTCPYADGGSYCKHMAAVLCKASSMKLPDKSEAGTETDISDLLENADRDELIAFLKELLMNDPSIANSFRARFCERLSEGDMWELKREADEIFRSHEDRGFINYHEAFAFQVEIERFLEEKTEALLEHEDYAAAFEISTYVFVKLAETDIDDDGEIQSIAAVCHDIWKRIISSCGEAEYTRIKNWFENHAYEGKLIDYMEEYLQEFLETEMASEEDLRDQMKLLDEKIEEAGQRSDCPMEYSNFGPSVPAVLKRIELMEKLGATKQETEEYRRNHRHFSAIREQYMEEAENAGEPDKLIALLKESRELDAADSRKVQRYSVKLAELYHKMGDRLNERNERYEMYRRSAWKDIEQFKTVKSLCTEAEWPVYRDGMIAATTDKALKCEIYAEEGMTDRLYELIFESPQISLLDRYGSLIEKDHSAEILQFYEKHVRNIAENARSRPAYGQMIDCLSRMKNYSGGKDLAEKLAAEWIEAYPTRKLMVSELKKLL